MRAALALIAFAACTYNQDFHAVDADIPQGGDAPGKPNVYFVEGVGIDVNEGGTGTFKAYLTNGPHPNDVTLQISSQDPTRVTVETPSVTIKGGSNDLALISVFAQPDPDAVENIIYVDVSSPDVIPNRMIIDVHDDDFQAIDVSKTTLAIDEGSTGSLGVRLAAQPQGDVFVMAYAMAPDQASPQTLDFTPTNWNVYQGVTVTSTHDTNTVSEDTELRFASADTSDRVVAIHNNDAGP